MYVWLLNLNLMWKLGYLGVPGYILNLMWKLGCLGVPGYKLLGCLRNLAGIRNSGCGLRNLNVMWKLGYLGVPGYMVLDRHLLPNLLR